MKQDACRILSRGASPPPLYEIRDRPTFLLLCLPALHSGHMRVSAVFSWTPQAPTSCALAGKLPHPLGRLLRGWLLRSWGLSLNVISLEKSVHHQTESSSTAQKQFLSYYPVLFSSKHLRCYFHFRLLPHASPGRAEILPVSMSTTSQHLEQSLTPRRCSPISRTSTSEKYHWAMDTIANHLVSSYASNSQTALSPFSMRKNLMYKLFC